MITKAGIQWLEGQWGGRVVQDVHGLVFESEPWPKFARSQADAVVGRPVSRFVRAVEAAEGLNVSIANREKTAFDLYSGSLFVASLVDARFLMLMMAMETLIQPERRSESAVAHVEDLIQRTRESGLPPAEVSSLVGSLNWLLDEVVCQA